MLRSVCASELFQQYEIVVLEDSDGIFKELPLLSTISHREIPLYILFSLVKTGLA